MTYAAGEGRTEIVKILLATPASMPMRSLRTS